MTLRKIFVFLILLSLATVLLFADGWLNANSQIQNSFKENSPGSTLTQNFQSPASSLMSLNSSSTVNTQETVNALGCGCGKHFHTKTLCVSNTGSTSVVIPLCDLNLPIWNGNKGWTYKISITRTSAGISGANAAVSSSKPEINLNATITNISSTQHVDMKLTGTKKSTYGCGCGGKITKTWYIRIYFKKCSFPFPCCHHRQTYIATATSYDASFCGATGNVLTNSYTPLRGKVLLAELTVKSNRRKIKVLVSTSVNGHSPTPGINPSGLPDGMKLKYAGSLYNKYNRHKLKLSGYCYYPPYSGTLDIVTSNNIAPWSMPGETTLKFTFTIVPIEKTWF